MVTELRSMTGVAWGSGPWADGTVVVELRSVNGKGLTVKHRLPPELASFERAIEDRIKARLHRGSVVVEAAVDAAQAGLARVIDRERFATAAALLRELADAAGLAAPCVADVLALPGVVAAANAVASDLHRGGRPTAPPELIAVVDEVIERLCRSRADEGRATAAAIVEQLDALEAGLVVIAARAPLVVDEHRARLIERVNEFLVGRAPKLAPEDVVRELGVFADRVDVSEELQRLRAHLDRLRAMLADGGQIGRQLEFLVQELLRETNTIGSKSPDVDIAHTVVAMKSAIDRLKEQAANLE